jgi:predicted nucleic acid-binding protein
MVVVDATFLLLFLDPSTKVPGDKNGSPTADVQARISLLLSSLKKSKQPIIIPTPVLSEVLLIANTAVSELVDKINQFSAFEIVPFDQIAAIELADMARPELSKKRDSATTYAKLKYDRQIIAIAKTRGATQILSDDLGLKTLGKKIGITVTGIAELPVPTKDPQSDMFANANAGKPEE